MSTNKTIIVLDGETYVHMPTLISSIRDQTLKVANDTSFSYLAPGMASVLDYIEREHVNATLSDRQD